MAKEPTIYDLMLLLSTSAEDERRAQILANVEAAIQNGGGTIERNDDWGSRPLPYRIAHQREAEYHLLQFSGPTSLLEALSHDLRIADGVLRFRIIKVLPGSPTRPSRRLRSSLRPSRPSPPRTRSASSAPAPQRLRYAASRLRHGAATFQSIFRGDRGFAPGPCIDSPKASNEHRKEPPHGRRHQPSGHHRQTDEGPRAQVASGRRHLRLQLADREQRATEESRDNQWKDAPNYFDVSVWSPQGETAGDLTTAARSGSRASRFRESDDAEGRSATRWISSLNPFNSSAGAKTPVTGMVSRAARARPRATSRSTPVTSRPLRWLAGLRTTTFRSRPHRTKFRAR